jgi:glycerophosphoryl diester phosphodiesterase
MSTVEIVDPVPLQQSKLDNDEINSTTNSNDANVVVMGDPPRKSLRSTLGLDDNHDGNDLPEDRRQRQQHQQQQVVGHRGALYDTLENTRDGFMTCAIEYQCDAVELDVFALPHNDNLVVVFHGNDQYQQPGDLRGYCIGYDDDNYNTNHEKTNIMDLTYEEIGKLQFNSEFAEFPCPHHKITNSTIAYIPTLEQVLLDLKHTSCQLKIELKGPGVVQPVIALVEQLDMVHQCSYSSFDLTQLYELRQLRPDKKLYRTGALFADKVPDYWNEIVTPCDVNEIHIKYDCCHQTLIQNIHHAGYQTMAWLRGPIGMKLDCTTKYHDIGCHIYHDEDERCYQALIDTGVQQICCNKPNLLIRMLQQQAMK